MIDDIAVKALKPLFQIRGTALHEAMFVKIISDHLDAMCQVRSRWFTEFICMQLMA